MISSHCPCAVTCTMEHGVREERGGKVEDEEEGVTRKEAKGEGGRGIFGRDGECVVLLHKTEATVCSDTRQIQFFLKSDLKDGLSTLLFVIRLDVWVALVMP